MYWKDLGGIRKAGLPRNMLIMLINDILLVTYYAQSDLSFLDFFLGSDSFISVSVPSACYLSGTTEAAPRACQLLASTLSVLI